MVQSQNPGAKSTSPGILFRVISPASTLSACLRNAPATGAVWITTATRGMDTGPNGAMSAPSVAGVASALALAVTPRPQTGASRARVILRDLVTTPNLAQVRMNYLCPSFPRSCDGMQCSYTSLQTHVMVCDVPLYSYQFGALPSLSSGAFAA